jgi:hypothetical protein
LKLEPVHREEEEYSEIKHGRCTCSICYWSKAALSTVTQAVNSSLLCSQNNYKNVKIRIHKTIILSVVLYGCETWSPTLREKHRLRVFENRMLR